MEVLRVEGGEDRPKVVLDKENNIFEISGRSIPEDVTEFFNPILDWLDVYAQEPLEETVFNFKLEYYNTASSRLLLDVLLKLEDIYKDNHKVFVNWYYPQNDGDIEDGGKDYFELVKIPHAILPREVVTAKPQQTEPVEQTVSEPVVSAVETEEKKQQEPEKPKCPFCGSENIEKIEESNFVQKVADVFKSLIGSKPEESGETVYKCGDCGKKWNEK
jgi:DNA-directed RNA polymerase subunit M/transcription elongation factor TFIIS